MGRVIGSVSVGASRQHEPARRNRPVQSVEESWRCLRPAQERQVVPQEESRIAGIAFSRREVVKVPREGFSYTTSAADIKGSGADIQCDYLAPLRLKDEAYAASSRADVEDVATAPVHGPPV